MSSLMATVPVSLVAALLVLAAVLAALGTLMRGRQPWWALPAVLAGLLAPVILMAAPAAQAVPQGSPLPNVGGGAHFGKFHDAFRAYLGNPVGECEMRYGILVCWTMYARPEYHPDQPQPYYQLLLGNLGHELLEARGLTPDPNPVVPPIVLAYFVAETNRDIDVLYWAGPPLTNPRVDGERTEQYFAKTVLVWPTGSSDPAEVKREPVGAQVWSLEHRPPEEHPGASPWTPLRLGLLGAAVAALVVSFVGLLWSRLFGGRAGYDFD
ncbi:MAG: hypothetical protein ACRDS0_40840 [Pseudonocardiaceae bacterium]